MAQQFKWVARCEYPLGVERFVVTTDTRSEACDWAEAYKRDGFFKVTVRRIEVSDDASGR